jgi:opacity protein-like surface antigen
MLNKKNILSVTCSAVASLLFATTANATVSGPYLGGDLGWGTTHQQGFEQIDILKGMDVNTTQDGLAGRIFAGFKFNEYLAAEMGYTKFSNQTSKFNQNVGLDNLAGNEKIQAYAVDLVAKGTLPLQNGFSLFGKLGAAYLAEDASATVTASDPFFGTVSDSVSQNTNKILPTFGLGVSYDINSNLSTEVSWMHIQKVGTTDLQNTDFIGLGLTYNFG